MNARETKRLDFPGRDLFSASVEFARLPRPEPSAGSRLAALAFLSDDIPADRVAGDIARTVHAQSNERVLLVRVDGGAPGFRCADWNRRCSTLNGDFALQDRLASPVAGCFVLHVAPPGNLDDAAAFASLLAHCREHFSRVLVQTSQGFTPTLFAQALADLDSAFVIFKNSPAQVRLLDRWTHALHGRDDARARIAPVLYVEDDKPAHGLADLIDGRRPACDETPAVTPMVSALEYLRDRKDAYGARIRSLARAVLGRRVGLALSSGGAKGLAHIGVIQVLEENGIEVDAVAGCSMGSYIAAIWAHGEDGVEMERLAREIETRWGLWKLIDPALPPRRGFVHGRAVIRRLKRTVGDAHFSDLVRPLRIVATNLDTLERMVFSSGEVAVAVHASSAIPGICVPVNVGGETCIDGGVTDPLPVDVLRDMGIERVIAVNTIPTPAYLKCCRELAREQADLKRDSHRLAESLSRHVNYFARGNVLDIMMRAVHGAQIRVAEAACRRADLVLRPLACDARWHDFANPGKYIALGRRIAEEHLDELKALAANTPGDHEPEREHHALAVSA